MDFSIFLTKVCEKENYLPNSTLFYVDVFFHVVCDMVGFWWTFIH